MAQAVRPAAPGRYIPTGRAPSLRFEHTMPRDLTAPAHETASRTGAFDRILVLRADDFRVGILLRFWTGSTLFGGLSSAHVTLQCIVDLIKIPYR